MLLCDLYLRNFRNYKEAFVKFCPGVNRVYGDNAQGKTNLLEAIHLLMVGRSFRTNNLDDLIREGNDHFYLEAHFVKNGVKQRLRVYYDKQQKKVIHNSTVYPSFAYLIGLLPGITITSEDQSIIKGSPADRRRFLDLQIAQVDPLYVHHFVRYNKAMKQRNHLLRMHNMSTIGSWEKGMAYAAAYVVGSRRKVIDQLLFNTKKIHHALTNNDDELQISYKTVAPEGPSVDELERYYIETYQKQRHKDVVVGYTSLGPHRDDLTMYIKKKNLRYFASEGQQRSCVIAMRLSQWQCLAEAVDCKPLMVIDDAVVSLDNSRIEYFSEQIQTLGQVFLSSPQELPWQLGSKESKTIFVKEGQILS